MSEQIHHDLDLDFFNSNIPYAPGSSPSNFLFGEDFTGDNSTDDVQGFNTHKPSDLKHQPLKHTSFQETRRQELSAPSSVSPPGSSFQDSSSDSSGYKRKTSSDSSRSALTGKDDIMMDGSDWKDDTITGGTGYGPFNNGTIDPATMDYSFNDQAMEDSFDFNGASGSNSPIHFGAGVVDMDSPDMQPIKHDTPRKSSPKIKSRFGHHNKANSVCFSLCPPVCQFFT